MISTRSLISDTFIPCTNLWVTVIREPVTTDRTATFMHLFFFNSLAKSKYLSFFSLSFSFALWSAGTENSTIQQVALLLFLLTNYSLVVWPRLGDLFVSQNPRGVCVSFSSTDSGFSIYHLFVLLLLIILLLSINFQDNFWFHIIFHLGQGKILIICIVRIYIVASLSGWYILTTLIVISHKVYQNYYHYFFSLKSF